MTAIHADKYYTSIENLTNSFDRESRQMGLNVQFKVNSIPHYDYWKKILRMKLIEITGMGRMEKCELMPELLETVQLERYRRDKFIIQTEPGVWMPFYVLIPNSIEKKGKHPCMIACHGHSSVGKNSSAGRKDIPSVKEQIQIFNYDYGVKYAEKGYIVFCPDARAFGERRDWARQGDEEVNFLHSSCQQLNNMAICLGRSVIGMWIWDLMRLIDHIENREDCDPDKIGCAGLSSGGVQTLWLAAMDDRVRCAVDSGYFYGYKDSLLKFSSNCACNYVPHIWEYMDIGDLGALVAPKPLLIETGDRDPLNGERGVVNVTEQLDITRKAYEIFNAEGRLHHYLFEGEHLWNGEKSYEFVERWMKESVSVETPVENYVSGGNHEDMIFGDKSYGFITDRILNVNHSMSFLNEKYSDLHKWREEARKFTRERLFYKPDEVPFGEEITEEEDFGKYTRQKLYFNSAPGCRVPAYLLIPKNLKAPAAGIIALHDHGAMFYWGKEKMVDHKKWHPVLKRFVDMGYSGQPVASILAEKGYVVLVIDSIFFGERRFDLNNLEEYKHKLDAFQFESQEYILKYNTIEQRNIEPEIIKSIYYSGSTFMGIRTWDDIASVSYLCSRPEVDSGRIGCIGLSIGGHRSGWLSAMDDRVKCAVVVCWMAGYREMTDMESLNIVVPGTYGYLDYPDIISISAPKPLMVMHGTRDILFIKNKTGERAMDKIRNVYRKAGCEYNFTGYIYDGVHEFNKDMQQMAYNWLDKNLILNDKDGLYEQQINV